MEKYYQPPIKPLREFISTVQPKTEIKVESEIKNVMVMNIGLRNPTAPINADTFRYASITEDEDDISAEQSQLLHKNEALLMRVEPSITISTQSSGT